MNIRELRFVTAVAVIGLSAFAAYRGAEIVRFSLAMGSLKTATRAATLRSWYSVPGLGQIAREAALPRELDATSSEELTRQYDALTDYLSVTPAASLQWLMLAAARLLLGETNDSVIAAYQMSVVTGPNENDVIVERSKFGLSIWDDLPPELKQREIDDLTLGFFSGPDKENLRKALAAMSASAREEVLGALPRQRLAALGI